MHGGRGQLVRGTDGVTNHDSSAKKRVAILISGRGSNMMSLVNAMRTPGYPAEPVVVISNRPDAPGLEWAKSQGLPAIGLDHTHYESRAHFEGQLQGLLATSKVDLVCLAGFMRLMTPGFVEAWRDRMLNIHPALLPAFKGLDTHARALAAGVLITGCTVHVVRPQMDEGPIIAQAAVPVLAGDTAETLGQRVLAAEHRLYPEALKQFALGNAKICGEKVEFSSPINQVSVLYSPSLSDPVSN